MHFHLAQHAEARAFIITLDLNKHQHYYFNGDVFFYPQFTEAATGT